MRAGRLYCLTVLMLVVPEYAAESSQRPVPTFSQEVIIFENGDRLTGSVVSITEFTITFVTEFGVSILVPKNKVKELQKSKAVGPETKDRIPIISPDASLSPEVTAAQTADGVKKLS